MRPDGVLVSSFGFIKLCKESGNFFAFTNAACSRVVGVGKNEENCKVFVLEAEKQIVKNRAKAVGLIAIDKKEYDALRQNAVTLIRTGIIAEKMGSNYGHNDPR